MKLKVKIALVVVLLLLVVAQIWYTRSRQRAAAPAAATTTETTQTTPAVTAAPEAAAIPKPDEVASIAVDAAGETLELRQEDGRWLIASRGDVPADSRKIDRFLNALLRGEQLPPPLNTDPAVTGLGDGDEITVRLALTDGGEYPVHIGLRPEGHLQAVFARFGDGGIVVLESDIRGELGVWRNSPGQPVDMDAWVLTRVLDFDPARVTALAAKYPDHDIAFERGEDGEWRATTHVPGGEWSREALDDWIADLSTFTAARMLDGGELAQAVCMTRPVTLAVSLDDGTVKSLHACLNLTGDGMHIGVGDYPGLVFDLPAWRFGKYFLRMNALFPKAAPRFSVDDISLLDIRRGGDSAKVARVNGEWRAVGLPYPLRPERIDHLARLVAGLTPEDYADQDAKPLRSASGGRVVEVILADGTLHRYRLGGRHPIFQWRYVTVDGGVISLSDAEAGVLFPGFEEVLDLGDVFPGLDEASLARVELIRAEDGTRLVSVRRDEDAWIAENERVSLTLTPDEAERLVGRLARWRVAGLHEVDMAAGAMEGMMRLRVADASGAERRITLLTPQGRDIPYLADGSRAYLLDRTEFFSWLGAVRAVSRRIDDAAKAEAESDTVETPEDATDVTLEVELEPEPDASAIPDDAPEEQAEPVLKAESAGEAQDAVQETTEPESEVPAAALEPDEAAIDTAEAEFEAPAAPAESAPEADAPAATSESETAPSTEEMP